MTTFTRLPLTDAVEVARNWMPNGSFETDYNGWVASTNASSLAVVDKPGIADAAEGVKALRWTATAAGETQVRCDTANHVPTLPGETVNVAADFLVQSGTTSRPALLAYEFLNGSGVLIGAAVLGPSSLVNAGTAWTSVEHSAVAPAGTAWTRVLARFTAAGAGQQLYVDAVMVTKDGVPARPYFDGATAAALPHEYRWTGPAYRSASVKLEQIGGGADTLVPPLIVKPYRLSRRVRNTAHMLAQSSDVRYTLTPSETASGVLQLTYLDEADAIAALAYFDAPGEFVVTDPDIASLPAQFVVSDGELALELDDAVQLFHVYVPWKETA